MRKTSTITLFLGLIGLAFVLAGCSAVQKGADILAEKGKISQSDRDSLVKTSEALRSSFSEITEEEEYYIGRAVAAMILSRYKVYENAELTRYLNVMGNAVAFNSSRPETFAGYHFTILDSDEINALAAPSGFVFITKGLLKRCRDEEMLASVLAHEIGHVCAKHGLQSIKKSRLIDAFKLIGQQAVDRYGPEQLSRLTNIFEDVLGDIAESLIERGYDRKYEFEADQLALKFGAKTGYNPNGLTDFLGTLVGDPSASLGKGWFKTHPTADQRIEKVKSQVSGMGSIPAKEDLRTKRFLQYVKNAG